MWLCLGLQIPRILFNSGCSCHLQHGRVVNTGIGIGLQNRKCGSDSHLALQQFQWLCGVKVVSPPSQGGDAGALPARAANFNGSVV